VLKQPDKHKSARFQIDEAVWKRVNPALGFCIESCVGKPGDRLSLWENTMNVSVYQLWVDRLYLRNYNGATMCERPMDIPKA